MSLKISTWSKVNVEVCGSSLLLRFHFSGGRGAIRYNFYRNTTSSRPIESIRDRFNNPDTTNFVESVKSTKRQSLAEFRRASMRILWPLLHGFSLVFYKHPPPLSLSFSFILPPILTRSCRTTFFLRS